jgi:hypothetical protein
MNKEMNIKVLDKQIKSDSEMKLLGNTFDEHLKFSSHIDDISKTVSRKVGVLMRLRNLLPTLATLRLFVFWHLVRPSNLLDVFSRSTR